MIATIDRLIVIYSSGRSGSTLVSQLLNELDTVVSLSEPDVVTQFVHLRRTHGEGEASLRDLLDCTIRFLFKPSAFSFGVFAHDAQAGTTLARENSEEGNQLRLSDEERQQITRILRRHPVVKTSDFVVPGTLRV